MIEVLNDIEQGNSSLTTTIEDSNYVFDKEAFLKKLGIIAAASFTAATVFLCEAIPDPLPFLDAAIYGSCFMGGLTVAVGTIGGIKAKKASNACKESNKTIDTIVKNTNSSVLEDTEKMTEAMKKSESIPVTYTMSVENDVVKEKRVDFVFVSPETSVTDSKKCTYIFRQETNYDYSKENDSIKSIGPVSLVEPEDFSDPLYADELNKTVERFTGNLIKKKTR